MHPDSERKPFNPFRAELERMARAKRARDTQKSSEFSFSELMKELSKCQ